MGDFMSRKYTLTEIRAGFKSVGCELLSKFYLDANQQLEYKCSCGGIFKTRWSNFNKGIRHLYCPDGQHHRLSTMTAAFRTYTVDNIQTMMLAQGLWLLRYDGLGRKTYLECRCGIEFFKTFSEQTIFNFHECEYCAEDRRLKTYADRHRGSKYDKWKDDVKLRDNYTCKKCGCHDRDKLNSHHIKSWKDFPELRYDVSNGLTLCTKCHKEEH